MGDPAHEVHDDEMPQPLAFVFRIGAIAKMLLFGWLVAMFRFMPTSSPLPRRTCRV
jgi:hypothetical protein